VNVYFYREISEKNQKRPTCQDYIEIKHLRMKKKHLEESGRQPLGGEGPPIRGRAPTLGRSQSWLSSWIMPPPPLKINLNPSIKVGLIRQLTFLEKGYISKAPWPRRNENSFIRGSH
jgi:hypothetical protein